MKHLTLIRHAKSSWNDPDSDDFERGLKKRGKRDAPLMGKWLQHKKAAPNAIWSSNAVRARKTLRGLREEWQIADNIISYSYDLYHCGHHELLQLISEAGDDINDLCILGHNPGIEDCFNQLSSKPCAKFVTCAVARLLLPIKEWSEVTHIQQTADTIYYQYPKNLLPAEKKSVYR